MKPAQPSFFVLIALIGGLAIFSSTLSKTPVLPLFALSLNATPAEIGWIVMASTIPGILISYPAGALSCATWPRSWVGWIQTPRPITRHSPEKVS